MTFRRFDSSKTRVAPVFNAISETGEHWLQQLLALPRHGHPAAQVAPSSRLQVLEQFWGDKERGLAPPVSLLSWLIRNLPVDPPADDTSASAAERRLLRAGDPEAIARALTLLRSSPAPRGWHILEGNSYPDAFIVTPDAIVVVEGKRTEARPTIGTTWMPGRHQMLRHLDAAWEIRGRRSVYGFFIVEALPGTTDVPASWMTAAAEVASQAALEASLPHRSQKERDGIARGFLGVTTWQAVCDAFCLPEQTLLEEVAENREGPDASALEDADAEAAEPAASGETLSRLERVRLRALGAAGELSGAGKSRLRSAQDALGAAAKASGERSRQALERGKAMSQEGIERASAAAADAWTGVSAAGAAALGSVTAAPVALLNRLVKDCAVPAYLLPLGSGRGDFYCTFDFRAAVEKLESGRLVRPRIQVWAGRADIDKVHLAEVLRSRFSAELSAERERRLEERGRGFSTELEALQKNKETAGSGVEAAGGAFVASVLTMFFVANPFFNLVFLVLAIFTGTAGLTHAFQYVRSAARISSGSAAARRERQELESLLDSRNEVFQEAVGNLVVHVHPLLHDLTTDFCDLDDRPFDRAMAEAEEAPVLDAFLASAEYRSRLSPWCATLVDARLGDGRQPA